MRIYKNEILENKFLEFLLKNAYITVNDIKYRNVYSVIITSYNNSYYVKAFDYYEKNIFCVSSKHIKYIEFINIDSSCYKLSIF